MPKPSFISMCLLVATCLALAAPLRGQEELPNKAAYTATVQAHGENSEEALKVLVEWKKQCQPQGSPLDCAEALEQEAFLSYAYEGDFTKALSNYKEVVRIYQQQGKPYEAAKYNFNIGFLHQHLQQHDTAEIYLAESLGFFQQCDTCANQTFQVLQGMATNLQGQGRIQGAILRYQEAMDIRMDGQVLGSLGALYVSTKQYHNAITYITQSLDSLKAKPLAGRLDSLHAASCHFNLGLAYQYTDLEKAIQNLESAKRYRPKEDGVRDIQTEIVHTFLEVKGGKTTAKEGYTRLTELISLLREDQLPILLDAHYYAAQVSLLADNEQMFREHANAFHLKSDGANYDQRMNSLSLDLMEAAAPNQRRATLSHLDSMGALVSQHYQQMGERQLLEMAAQVDYKVQQAQLEQTQREKALQAELLQQREATIARQRRNLALLLGGLALLLGLSLALVHYYRRSRRDNHLLAEANTQLGNTSQRLASTNSQLAQTVERLTWSNQQLERYANMVSHDLKQPIRNIHSFSQLLSRKRKGLNPEQEEFLGFILDSSEHLGKVVENLLDTSKVGHHQLPRNPVSIKTVLEQVRQNLHLEMQESACTLHTEDLPTVQGDELLLGQLFQNLVSNAIRYRQKGIAPTVCVRGREAPQEGMAAIEVQDNGIGMEARHLAHIFDMHYQVSPKSSLIRAGQGIGLATCKRIVEQHSGSISVQSTPGQGSTFLIILPKT